MVKAGAPEAGWWSGCGSLGTQGTLCSSALRLDGQANPGVNESSLHGSFHPGIKKGCSEPRSMSRGVTADRQPDLIFLTAGEGAMRSGVRSNGRPQGAAAQAASTLFSSIIHSRGG